MNIINLGRQNGKTRILIDTSIATGYNIVCCDEMHKRNIEKAVEKLGFKDFPTVYNYHELIRMSRSYPDKRNIKGLLFDDIEHYLEDMLKTALDMSNVNIIATISVPMNEVKEKCTND